MHRNLKNLTGKTFGHWTVIERGPNGSRVRWHCKCSCGTERLVQGCHLMSGKSSNCGCSRPRGAAAGKFKHGLSGSVEHHTWMAIISRCQPANEVNRANYYGRGIRVCNRWKNDFMAFYEDMGPRPSAEHSIERRDNSRGYEPNNCYWATRKEQMRNNRRNRLVRYKGREMPLSAACELSGVNYGTAKWRLNNGRSDEEAFS